MKAYRRTFALVASVVFVACSGGGSVTVVSTGTILAQGAQIDVSGGAGGHGHVYLMDADGQIDGFFPSG